MFDVHVYFEMLFTVFIFAHARSRTFVDNINSRETTHKQNMYYPCFINFYDAFTLYDVSEIIKQINKFVYEEIYI